MKIKNLASTQSPLNKTANMNIINNILDLRKNKNKNAKNFKNIKNAPI